MTVQVRELAGGGLQTPLTSQLCDEGVRSSYFLPVKISMATKWHFA